MRTTFALGAAFVTGFLTGRLLWVLLRRVFAQPGLLRENHAGRMVPVAAGVVVPLAVVIVEVGRVVADRLGIGDSAPSAAARGAVLAGCLGFGLLGLFDDLAGTGDRRGFRGHLSELVHGHLTSGGMKLVAGLAIGLLVAGPWAGPGLVQLLADGVLVALAANLVNLLDRAPGRAGKSALVAFMVLTSVATSRLLLTGVAVAIGAGAALLLDDLRERLMLGDTGANVLGAVLGIGIVESTLPHVRLIVVIGLLVANLSSEVISFSRVIDAVPPLRFLDRVGRRS